MSSNLARNTSGLTANDVRLFMMDRTPEDNPLQMDLAFSDEEIHAAMDFTAMAYNSSVIIEVELTPFNLPRNMGVLSGVVYFLLLSYKMKLSRRVLEYTAGNMSVNVVAAQIRAINDLLPVLKNDFDTWIKDVDLANNIAACWGRVG